MGDTNTLQAIVELLRSDLTSDHKVAAMKLVLDAWRHWYDNKYR